MWNVLPKHKVDAFHTIATLLRHLQKLKGIPELYSYLYYYYYYYSLILLMSLLCFFNFSINQFNLTTKAILCWYNHHTSSPPSQHEISTTLLRIKITDLASRHFSRHHSWWCVSDRNMKAWIHFFLISVRNRI